MIGLPPDISKPADNWLYEANFAYRRFAFGSLINESSRRIDALRATNCEAAHRIGVKLMNCCKDPMIISCNSGERYYLAEQRCRSRICPRCSRIRANMLAQRIVCMVRTMDAPRFLTLTIRSNEQPLRDQLNFLRRKFASLRRTECWQSRVTGGVYTIEITFNFNTQQWHPHLHCIIDGSYFPHAELLEIWEKIVKDDAGIDIRQVTGVRKLANYLACYVAKSCDLDHLKPKHLAEWAVQTHGLRLAQTFGGMHACKPSNDRVNLDYYKVVDTSVNNITFMASHGCQLSRTILALLTSHDPLGMPDFLNLIEKFHQNPCDREKPPKRPKKLSMTSLFSN